MISINENVRQVLFGNMTNNAAQYPIRCSRFGKYISHVYTKYVTVVSSGRDVKVGSRDYIDLRRKGIIRGDEPQFKKESVVITSNAPQEIVEMRLSHVRRIKNLPRTGPATMSAAGWEKIAPKSESEKALLRNECGDVCFIESEAICPQTTHTNGICAVDCRGLASLTANTANASEIISDLQNHFQCN